MPYLENLSPFLEGGCCYSRNLPWLRQSPHNYICSTHTHTHKLCKPCSYWYQCVVTQPKPVQTFMSPDNLQLPWLLQPFFLSPATFSVVHYPLPPPQWPHSQRKSNSTHHFTTRLPPLRTTTLKDHSLYIWTQADRWCMQGKVAVRGPFPVGHLMLHSMSGWCECIP